MCVVFFKLSGDLQNVTFVLLNFWVTDRQPTRNSLNLFKLFDNFIAKLKATLLTVQKIIFWFFVQCLLFNSYCKYHQVKICEIWLPEI